MTNREEEQKYQKKIEELHALVEKEAKELSQAQVSKEDAIRDRNNALKEKELLQAQASKLTAEVEKLDGKMEARRTQHENIIASRNLKCRKLEKDIKTLQSAKAKLISDVQKKKVPVKDLASLEKKYSKVFASYKKVLADSETARNEYAKARKQAKQVLELSAKILSRAKEREAQSQAQQNAINKARKTLLFYAKRINQWNQSKGLKLIDIQL